MFFRKRNKNNSILDSDNHDDKNQNHGNILSDHYEDDDGYNSISNNSILDGSDDRGSIINDDHHIDEMRKLQEQNTILSQKNAKKSFTKPKSSGIIDNEIDENDVDIEIRVDKSFFALISVGIICLFLPIFYLVIFGKNISVDSLKNNIQNVYTDTEISASKVRLYLRPFPVFVVDDVYFVSKKKGEEFVLQSKVVKFYSGFGAIFGIKSGFINDILISSGNLIIQNQTKNLQEILSTLLQSQIISKSKTKKLNLEKLSISFVDNDGFVKSGFNVSRGILKSSPRSTKFEGGVVMSSLLYDVKYSSTKDYHAMDDKEKTNIDLLVDTDVFSASLSGFLYENQGGSNVLESKLNFNVRSVSALLANNLSNQYGISILDGKKDVSNISVQSQISYDITNNKFIKVSGLINQDNFKVGNVSLVSKNDNSVNAIDFIINSLKFSDKKQYKTDISSKYYKEVMSYDGDDISYLKTPGTQSFIKSLSDTTDGISVEDKIKKIVEQKLSNFGIMDIFTNTPINVNWQVENIILNDKNKISANIESSMSDTGIVVKKNSNLKFSTQNGITIVNIDGVIENGIKDNAKTIISFGVESQNLMDIGKEIATNDLAANLFDFITNDFAGKMIKLKFDFILQKDILAIDNIFCKVGDNDLSIEAKMQFAAVSKDATIPYRLYAFKLNNLKLDIDTNKLLKFKIFSSKNYLLDKILFIKSMPFDLSIFSKCYNCTINGILFDKFTSSLDINSNEFNFNIIDANSKIASFNLNTKIEVPFGVPTLEIDSHIDNLDLTVLKSMNASLNKMISSKNHIFIPSINQFFGHIKMYSNDIKTKNYLFNDLTFESDIANGVVKIIKGTLSGKKNSDNSNVMIAVNGDVSMQTTPIYSLSFGLKNFNTNSIMSVFSKYDNLLSGVVDFSGRVVSSGNSFADFFKNLSMDSTFKSYNTVVENFDVNSLALSLINPNIKTMQILSNQNILLKSLYSGKKNIYSVLQGKLVAKNGIFTFMDTILKSNLSNTAFDISYSPFTTKYSLVAKSAINALNFTSNTGSTVPIFLSFSGSNADGVEKLDSNFTQVLSYIKSYNEHSVQHPSKKGAKKRRR